MEIPSASNGTPEMVPDLKFVSGAAQEGCELERAKGTCTCPQPIPCVVFQTCRVPGCVGVR